MIGWCLDLECLTFFSRKGRYIKSACHNGGGPCLGVNLGDNNNKSYLEWGSQDPSGRIMPGLIWSMRG